MAIGGAASRAARPGVMPHPIYDAAVRAHALLSLAFLLSRVALDVLGLQFQFSLDWMWLSDPADLRDRLLETLYFFHAFPPGMNLVTGLLLKPGGSDPAALGHTLFLALGLVFVNALFYVGRASGLRSSVAYALTMAFALTPSSIYFEHLYFYEWPIATLLCLMVALFYAGVRRASFGVWLACFSACAVIGLTRSTFHLAWFGMAAGLAWWCSARGAGRIILATAAVPAAVLFGLYLKNFALFGDFSASTYGPGNLTLVTVDRLPAEVRDAWIAEGTLSPFAAVSVYAAAPRDYARFFATPEHEGWPPQMTRLDRPTVRAPNFNHWWLLDVHRARLGDALHYLRRRPLDYAANVLEGVKDLFAPSTTWHPRDADGTDASPHYQHRQVLGRYEAWFNRVVHGAPLPPVGLYVFLPVPMAWALLRGRALVGCGDTVGRARGSVLVLCVFHVVYVVAASTMLTSLESARYRYQIEWMIWLIAALYVSSLWQSVERFVWQGRHDRRRHERRHDAGHRGADAPARTR